MLYFSNIKSKPSGFSRSKASAGPQRRRWSVESVGFKPQNDAIITSEHLQNNFQNVQKTTLEGPMTLSGGQILT